VIASGTEVSCHTGDSDSGGWAILTFLMGLFFRQLHVINKTSPLMKNTGFQTVINNVIPSIVVIWLMQMLSAGCEGLESTDNGLDMWHRWEIRQ